MFNLDACLKDKIFIAEKAMKQMDQIELKVEHDFSWGVYARTLYIPKGVILVGEIHKYENLNILVKGKIEVSVNERMEIIEAPFKVVSPPGTKRIAMALEDCIWMTIHGTHERNLEIIEDYFIAHNEEEYLSFCKLQMKLPGF